MCWCCTTPSILRPTTPPFLHRRIKLLSPAALMG
jgi:hypothetical protein